MDQSQDEKAKSILQEWEIVEAEAKPWLSLWEDVTHYTIPDREGFTTERADASRRGDDLLDGTAIQANEDLAAALHSLLTNPSTMWCGVTSGSDKIDAQDDVQKWNQETAREFHNVLNQTNFQTEVHEVYLDQGSIGIACLSMDEDDEKIVRFSTKHMKAVRIRENNKGIVDTAFFHIRMDARQLVQEYCKPSDKAEAIERKLGSKVLKAYNDGSLEKFSVIQKVYPRSDAERSLYLAGPKQYAFGSCYVLMHEKRTIKESGFQEFPHAIPRWSKCSGEKYGRSPGMKALPDIKMLQQMLETTLEGAERAVNPPLQSPDDGFLGGKLKTFPGGLNYYRSGTQDRIEPIFNDTKVDFGMQMVEDTRSRIRRAFYAEHLQLKDGPQMTAEEVKQRTENQMRFMGPILGRQSPELLQAVFDRVFGIMLRRGRVPKPIPAVLRGRHIRAYFTSQIARVQKMSEGDNILRAVSVIAPFANANPDVLDNFDADGAARFVARTYGLPSEMIREESKRDEIRKAKLKAKQDAAAAQQQQAQVDTAANALPAIAKAREAGIA